MEKDGKKMRERRKNERLVTSALENVVPGIAKLSVSFAVSRIQVKPIDIA